jgi:oxaloacetate decarboxylase alpha subunit
VDTAISSLSGGSGHVCTEALVESLRGTPADSGLSQEAMIPIADYVRRIRPKYAEFEASFTGSDPRIFISQIPGGMLSNLESQLKQMGAADKMDTVLEEVPRVRKEMGYIPLVTPTSQIVGTQAVFNVLLGERYKNVPQQSKDIFAGKYGATPAPVDAEIQKKVLNGEAAITCRPADLLPNEWDKLKDDVKDLARSDDDVLSYAVFPDVWKKFIADLNKPKEAPKPKPAAPAPTPAAAPVVGTNRSPIVARLTPGKRMHMELTVEGKRHAAEVEVIEG